MKPQSFESRRNSFFFFFFTRGRCVSCLRACLGARLLLQSYQFPNLSEGADRVDGQLRENKECPFSGVTKSGRIWRKVPESDARSVGTRMISNLIVGPQEEEEDQECPFSGVTKKRLCWLEHCIAQKMASTTLPV